MWTETIETILMSSAVTGLLEMTVRPVAADGGEAVKPPAVPVAVQIMTVIAMHTTAV